MKRMHLRLSCSILVAIVLLAPFTSRAETAPQPRHLVVISDLHFGLGKVDTSWHPFEDFRWSHALQGFLSKVSDGRTDLVIAGDLFEFWQSEMSCSKTVGNLGCSAQDLVSLAKIVVQAHKADLNAIRSFSEIADNQVYVVPGNHDAALLLPPVWAEVAKELEPDSHRVHLVESGGWGSKDGRVFVEHGHQIGRDVNRFPDWPIVANKTKNGELRMVRPWGENFVQKLFNDEERNYEVIDNLSPESYGAWYREVDRGFSGLPEDVARFIAFHLFESTPSQLGAELGARKDSYANSRDTIEGARNRGDELFAAAADSDASQTSPGQPGPSKAWSKDLRLALSNLARTMPESDLQVICARLQGTSGLKCDDSAGAIAETILPKSFVIGEHLKPLLATHPSLQLYIYAHTHDAAVQKIHVSDVDIDVFNTGAFQRLIDNDAFVELAKEEGLSPSQALKSTTLQQLAPCYTAVEVTYTKEPQTEYWSPNARLRVWKMDETAAQGAWLSFEQRRTECRPTTSAARSVKAPS